MPPKKAEQPKKKKQTVEDKKKGATAKKQIAQLQAQAQSNKSADQKRKDAEKARREKEKAAAEQAKKEAAELFKPVQVQKVPFGVDPKTVLCIFFKKGTCEKGKKCKFSHDPAVERKAEKRDLYSDSRDAENDKQNDTMDSWDEDKLRKVVLSKHGNPRTTTDKVCKYFIEAVENQKYGWFWTCPNGGDKCMYKHSLPPGFVLKTKEQKAAEKALLDKSPLKTLTLEEFLESERHKLTGNLTPVTEESFAKWKRERLDKKAAEEEARKAKEATGRALFESGNWKDSEDEDSEEDSDDEDQGAWNLEAMRKETEDLRDRSEQDRLAKLKGESLSNGIDPGSTSVAGAG
ncbi:Zinc finger CCCH type domain containing protein [Coccidioides posadasii C735 delta SOWgp]|uniref:Zinc finger CCCH type domain containing protein n=1 Tax=Coccidioides posadasii (strain C735) TaxID=222929 RepID=C5P6A5_COCP7|nr:Zinc finger CCCH type domain containing protein [Coccidioides posadasii C735 delta SOWgp]EER26955.1 Zinc finger CCCH type domain containing protein [Coccidioides posadasii C735 delta SOWgp]|eukprot:XP_003069100.1 Zinc finger CCCH type domain containing protein [Coccidioides posadasii C735 delta SOWgp]